MSKLSAIKKQIAALEARAQRIAKAEMGPAIAKVKAIMSEFNLTIEHLTQAVTGKAAAKKVKARAASVAKYADPKTGKQWSGFGRAPGWIAGAKNRDLFLIDKGAIKAAEPVAKAPAATGKKASVKTVTTASKPVTKSVAKKAAKKVAKQTAPAPKKSVPAAKKDAASAKKAAPAAKKAVPTAKKVAPAAPAADSAVKKKPSAKKVAAKKPTRSKAAPKASAAALATAPVETSTATA